MVNKNACITPLALSATGIITKNSRNRLAMFTVRATPYILMQKAVIRNKCRIVGHFWQNNE
jgi:hypothetical protein